MIENFFVQARKSYAEGLASLYTYERQIPEIAETKIQVLKRFYGVKSKEGLEFFEAHKSSADVRYELSVKSFKMVFLQRAKKLKFLPVNGWDIPFEFLSVIVSTNFKQQR